MNLSSAPLRVVLASANPDKAAEIRHILGQAGIVLLPRPAHVPEVEESGQTLLENARLKAAALCRATGMPAIADDTGLFVDALDGAPGVFSARFAGQGATYRDNVAKLLDMMGHRADRRARFVSVAMAVLCDGNEISATGRVEGILAHEARGTDGFGYDPVFIPEEGDGRTFAEMSAAQKHLISHRGRAFRGLAECLLGLAGEGTLGGGTFGKGSSQMGQTGGQ